MNPLLILLVLVAGAGLAGACYKAGESHERAKQVAAVAEKNTTIAKLNSDLAAETAKKATVIKEIVTEVQEVVVERPVPGKTVVLRPECDYPEDLRARLNKIR